jgi:hypothetical protein
MKRLMAAAALAAAIAKPAVAEEALYVGKATPWCHEWSDWDEMANAYAMSTEDGRRVMLRKIIDGHCTVTEQRKRVILINRGIVSSRVSPVDRPNIMMWVDNKALEGTE